MNTTVVEMPLVGTLTGSDIEHMGGWPKCGLELERRMVEAREAAMDAWASTGYQDEKIERRFHRLQVLDFMAGHRRHALQCKALGFPDEGRKHLARLWPSERLRFAAFHSSVPYPLRVAVLEACNIGVPAHERVTWKWKNSKAKEKFADHPIVARVDAYLEGAVRKEWL